MGKRTFLIVLAFILSLSSTGCWGRKSLKDLKPIFAFGIDKKEDKYLLTSQIINASEIAAKTGGYTTPITVYSAEGRSISEAFRKLTIKVPNQMYFGHLRILVFGEEVARDGLHEVLDYFMRDRESRNNYYLLVAQGCEASEVLKTLTPLDKIPANKISSALQMTQKFWSPGVTIKKVELLNTISAEGKEPVLTGVLLQGKKDIGMTKKNVESSEVPAAIQIGTVAVFKNDKLIGWLNEEQSSVINGILGKIKNTIRITYYEDIALVSLEVKKFSSKIRVVNDGGKPKIIVNEKIEADIAEVNERIEIKDPAIIKKIEQFMEDDVRQRIERAITEVKQKFNSDIFGFGNEILKQHPKLWREVRSTWNEQGFSKVPVEVKVKIKIVDTGTILNPIKGE
ncbi:spore germination protein KC [Clostridium polyendosporum]|uniref:Spore germination protein KC n=1 Tax=Clostridium polyendosporum TaxID=69208 RepID=A0A919VL41_9CLOT|nr:Ger(x)C family spore germination protein [Clostridium polyendosporum]GIM28218.1 spore germination protein KC [Clostridium polyendosporum]